MTQSLGRVDNYGTPHTNAVQYRGLHTIGFVQFSTTCRVKVVHISRESAALQKSSHESTVLVDDSGRMWLDLTRGLRISCDIEHTRDIEAERLFGPSQASGTIVFERPDMHILALPEALDSSWASRSRDGH